MLIYQGEQVTFSGHLKDNSGSNITDLSGYNISAALCRKDSTVAVWSTRTGAQDASSITIGSGGLVSFVLSGTVTQGLAGTYTFEVKLTNISTGEVAIGVSKDELKVALSNVGSRSDL